MSTEFDYLAIGHISRDESEQGPRLGGSVTFSALTARAFGLRPAIVTSVPPGSELVKPLSGIPTYIIPAAHFTTFENIYSSEGRTQILLNRAVRLDLPATKRLFFNQPPSTRILHLAPVADEVDPLLIDAFQSGFIGITPQGWMRQWDDHGHISFREWESIDRIAARAHAIVMSIEDAAGDEALVRRYAGSARVLVVTRGEQGSTLFVGGETYTIPAPSMESVDPTGAGDIFAAAFFIRLSVFGDPIEAARVATRLAGLSVAREGLEAIPLLEEVRAALS